MTTTATLTDAQRRALADRWEQIDVELDALEVKRAAIAMAAYEKQRGELLGEIDSIGYELGVDWMRRKGYGKD